MYTYVRTYAFARKMEQTLRVLPYARELHKDQVRKGKDQVPYIYHPLLLSCHALALGMEEDDLISAALLHDVCEDCGVDPEELPVNEATREAVVLLTRDYTPVQTPEEEEQKKRLYYEKIAQNRIATIVKLLDRCCNISGMAAGFTPARMAKYIKETEVYIYPLMDHAKNYYPQHSNQIFLIKYHMTSVLEAIRHQLKQ